MNPSRALFLAGGIVGITGAIFVAWQTNNHQVCTSVLIQVLANGGCGKANFIYGAGQVCLVAGIVLVVIASALTLRGASRK
jgi:hypothetical protein